MLYKWDEVLVLGFMAFPFPSVTLLNYTVLLSQSSQNIFPTFLWLVHVINQMADGQQSSFWGVVTFSLHPCHAHLDAPRVLLMVDTWAWTQLVTLLSFAYFDLWGIFRFPTFGHNMSDCGLAERRTLTRWFCNIIQHDEHKQLFFWISRNLLRSSHNDTTCEDQTFSKYTTWYNILSHLFMMFLAVFVQNHCKSWRLHNFQTPLYMCSHRGQTAIALWCKLVAVFSELGPFFPFLLIQRTNSDVILNQPAFQFWNTEIPTHYATSTAIWVAIIPTKQTRKLFILTPDDWR